MYHLNGCEPITLLRLVDKIHDYCTNYFVCDNCTSGFDCINHDKARYAVWCIKIYFKQYKVTAADIAFMEKLKQHQPHDSGQLIAEMAHLLHQHVLLPQHDTIHSLQQLTIIRPTFPWVNGIAQL